MYCSFLSCLITGVLTHHLSWASTVAPVGDTPASTYLDKHVAKWVSRSSTVLAFLLLLVLWQYFVRVSTADRNFVPEKNDENIIDVDFRYHKS